MRHHGAGAEHAERRRGRTTGPATSFAVEAAAPQAVDIGRELVGELDELGGGPEEDLPPVVLSAGEMSTLRSMLAELIDPANRDTITLLVLRFASNIVERAGLFLATRRAYVGLGGFSVDEPRTSFVARVRKIQIPVELGLGVLAGVALPGDDPW